MKKTIQFSYFAAFILPILFSGQSHAARMSPIASFCSDVVEYHSKIIFCHEDSLTGKELIISDGSKNGSFILKDLAPSIEGVNPTQPVVWKDHFYFGTRGANDGSFILWNSDGTESGTARLTTFPGGVGQFSTLRYLGEIGGHAIFSLGSRIVSTKGSVASTKVFEQMLPMNPRSNYGSIIINGKLYLVSLSSSTSGASALYSFTVSAGPVEIFSFPWLDPAESNDRNIGVHLFPVNLGGKFVTEVYYGYTGSSGIFSVNRAYYFVTNTSDGSTVKKFSSDLFRRIGVTSDGLILTDSGSGYSQPNYGPGNRIYSFDGLNISQMGTVDGLPTSCLAFSSKLVCRLFQENSTGSIAFNPNLVSIGAQQPAVQSLPFIKWPVVKLVSGRLLGITETQGCNGFNACFLSISANGTNENLIYKSDDSALDLKPLFVAKIGTFFKKRPSSRDQIWFTKDTPNTAKLLFESPVKHSPIEILDVFGNKAIFKNRGTVFIADPELNQSYQMFYELSNTAAELVGPLSLILEE